MSTLRPCSEDEVRQLIAASPTKSCALDPVSTFLWMRWSMCCCRSCPRWLTLHCEKDNFRHHTGTQSWHRCWSHIGLMLTNQRITVPFLICPLFPSWQSENGVMPHLQSAWDITCQSAVGHICCRRPTANDTACSVYSPVGLLVCNSSDACTWRSAIDATTPPPHKSSYFSLRIAVACTCTQRSVKTCSWRSRAYNKDCCWSCWLQQ